MAQVQRERLIDHRHAEKAVRHDDRARHHWVHGLFGVDVTDSRQFTVSVDASRLAPERIVELLLAAAGVPAPQPVAS